MIVRHVCGMGAAAMLIFAPAAFAQGNEQTTERDQQTIQGDQQTTQGDQQTIQGDQRTTQGDQRATQGDQRTTQGDQRTTQGDQRATTSPQATDQSESPITLVGCIQRERDYRRAQDAGRGGPAATGLGLGNEFVLVNASAAGTGSAVSTGADCSAAGGGEAYELTGTGERDLERYVGRRVELSGMLKRSDANTAVGTSGATAPSTRPSGGFDPLGQDLQLHEVNVTSVREVAATPQPAQGGTPTPTAPQATTPTAPRATTPEPRQPRPTGTSGTQNELPRTASPLALAALAGLLSLGGAMGIRAYRQRR